MENVKGILSWRNKNGEKVIDIILKTFEDLGYKVEVWILNAAEFGVPQNRERVFIVGNNLSKEISPPQPTHYIRRTIKRKSLKKFITVWQALSDLPQINAGEGHEEQQYTKKSQNSYQKIISAESTVLYNHVSMKHTKRLVERFKKIQNGSSLADIHDDYKVKKRNGNGSLSVIEFNSNYRHLKKNNISFTIPAHFYSSFIHPTRPRNITAREAARLQSFPDWYKFMGKRTVVSSKLLKRLGKHNENYLSQYNQIGNAVPPLLAKALAEHIKDFLDNNISNS
jgi:DNA (cytosine-5)-methyltransferase 1